MVSGQVCLRRGEEARVRSGAPWIFENELDWADDTCETGGVVDVLDSRLRFCARGFWNPGSKICVRVLTRDRNETIDRAFFRRRLLRAWEYRRSLGFENACRVVFGESDGLPGLTVDKFASCLSFQITSLGMERWKPVLIELLDEIFHPQGIFERNDVPVLVSIANGQKTGHFLDQQENRGRIRPYCAGRTVLDLCCCTGGFSIHAALYGAEHVESVDVSEEALALVRKNAARNGVAERITTTCANVFDLAREYSDAGKQYGLVICDPPAFAKSKKALEGAYRGYKELNLRSMKMVEPGGWLVSCSCSQFMTPELFLKMLREAAADCGRTVRLAEMLMQSRDHPADLAAEQSLYLKGYILQVL